VAVKAHIFVIFQFKRLIRLTN